MPGLTQSTYFDNLLRRDGRLNIHLTAGLTPADVAEGVLRSLKKKRAEMVLGREATWPLRINRFLPRLVDRLMARRVRLLYVDSQAGN